MEVAELDAEEQSLRDLGTEADRAEGRGEQFDVSATQKPADRAAGEAKPQETQPPATGEPEPKPVSSETEPTGEQLPKKPEKPATDTPRGEDGKFQKRETQQQPADGQGTAYQQAQQKEQERRDRSWAALNAEKEQFRAQQEQWAEQTRMAQLQSARQAPPIQKDGLDAKGYFEGYNMFQQQGQNALRNGDPEAAATAFRNAAQSLETAWQLNNAESQRQLQRDHAQAEYAWREQMHHIGTQKPEVFDPESPLAQKVDQLVTANPWLYYVPQGFMRAVEVAEMLSKMDSISELQDELVELRAFKEQTLKKGQPLKGGTPTQRGGAKRFDDMTLEEQEQYLTGATRQADDEMRG